MASAGERFVRALVARDIPGLRGVLADPVDFQALTPGRHWQASSGAEVAAEIILGRWFAPARIDRLCSLMTGEVAGRGHVAYRLQVRAWDGDYLIEQQAYYDTTEGGRIGWMRLLCSGYRPVLDPAR